MVRPTRDVSAWGAGGREGVNIPYAHTVQVTKELREGGLGLELLAKYSPFPS